MKLYPITKAKLWLRCLIAGEKCIACGEMNTRGQGLLCRACEDDLKRAHLLICPDCNRYARDCVCPSRIMQNSNLDVLIKYAFYDADLRDSALNRVIRRLKRIPDRLAFSYFAAILSQPLASLAAARSFTKDNTVIAHIPRSKRTIARDGHDQAEMLAYAIAKRSGFKHIALLRRQKHGKQQKYLHLDERVENVKGMFGISKRCDIAGKNVVLVDDLVTTGATVSEAARILYEAGAAYVACVCIAKSDKKI
ncbi:MAG: ComF family protein [Clostridia bacterium]|nr:ComF family protein [Clostridia bacterium]